MKSLRFLIPVLSSLLLVLTGCRAVDVLDALTPDTGYRLDSGIAYGPLERQKLDVYRPVAPRAAAAPVIVFYYGGSWTGGDRGDYRFVGQQLASLGFTTVIADYRLYPEVKFPAFLRDGALALRWTQDHIADYGGDPRRLFLMGHSAGAYNAMMLALDRRYGAAAGFDATRIRGVIGLAGPYDFKIDGDLLPGIFGGARNPADTQPVSFAAAGSPPVLLVTGDADTTVYPVNSVSLAAHLRAARSPVELLSYPGLDHIDVVLQLSRFRHPHSTVRDAIVRFLDQPAEEAGRLGP